MAASCSARRVSASLNICSATSRRASPVSPASGGALIWVAITIRSNSPWLQRIYRKTRSAGALPIPDFFQYRRASMMRVTLCNANHALIRHLWTARSWSSHSSPRTARSLSTRHPGRCAAPSRDPDGPHSCAMTCTCCRCGDPRPPPSRGRALRGDDGKRRPHTRHRLAGWRGAACVRRSGRSSRIIAAPATGGRP